jgi:ABC-type Fe3+/spermidine/putrescine transport system ATPase subunit
MATKSELTGSDVILSLKNITKKFGDFKAVDDLSLDIRRGEVFSLLGPSGCGKSTTLRQIAGLDQPDAGTILLRDRKLFSSDEGVFVATQKRNMGMVFQSYAIWPHLTVFETIAYPLRVRKWPSVQILEAVEGIIRQVQLDGMSGRSSTTLSGGQQQRVALARALVYKPDILLLDEPFSNLDVKLREQMRVELKILQRQIGVTVILVTHDQLEALSLSDRIAVMNAGHVEQIGSPYELYEAPKTAFVRDFIGQTTKIPAVAVGDAPDGGTQILVGKDRVPMRSDHSFVSASAKNDAVVACIRPENILIGPTVVTDQGNIAESTVETVLFLGDRLECVLDFLGQKILAYLPRKSRIREGERVPLQLPADSLSIWPA